MLTKNATMTQEPVPGNPAFIKIFGERHCGTRAAGQMLRQLPGITLRPPGIGSLPGADPALANLIRQRLSGRWARFYLETLRDEADSRVPHLQQWKHACPTFDDSYVQVNAHVLLMLRDPYSWAWAMWQHPYHVKGPRHDSLAAFLTCPWMTQSRDNAAAVYASPIQLWSAKLAAYEAFAKSALQVGVPVQLLHLHDFLPNPVGTLAKALRRFGLGARGLTAIPHSTTTPGRSLASVQAEFAQEPGQFADDAESIAMINDQVDWPLAERFGYVRMSQRKTGAAAAA